MKLKKHAQTSTVVFLIIILASALVIGILVYKVSTGAQSKTKIDACRFSILAAAQSKKLQSGNPLTEMKCPRGELGDVLLKKRDIVEDGKINQDKAHKIIADAMAECWYMSGEGKADPFANWDKRGISYCLICKTIKFDDDLLKFIKDNKGVVENPIPYLMSHEYRKGQTYYQYLFKENPKYSSEQISEMNKNFLAPDSQITLKLYKYKSKSTVRAIAEWVVIGVGAIAVVVGGILILTGVGAPVGFVIASGGATAIKLGLVVATAGIILAGVTYTGVAMFDPSHANPFSECAECNGIGTLKLIPPDFNLYQEVTINYGIIKLTEDGKPTEVIEKGPYCSFLVN